MKFAVSLSSLLIILPFFGSLAAATPALSLPVAPAPDGTGTAVTPDGNTFNIKGGSLSRDGANLFHSFQKFGLSEGQTANFISNPDIRNILGRVVGGDASYINGLIGVSGGNSNLFLMNPAGILFGPNAGLNVPASFTATTATGIGFGSGWFNAVGSNDYTILVGTPSAFNFAGLQPGAIVNEGNLSLRPGGNLALLGGTVINTGTLTSPGGNITIAAVPGESAVRLSQEGHLLSLDIEPVALGGSEVPPIIQPMSLPQLLTGRPDFGHASALSVSEKGEVSLTGSGVRIPASGGIAAGNIDTSSESGDGGAITLNATSDIITGSLRTAAGGTGSGGNIAISSSAGGINTSAGFLDASSYDGNGGNVTLSAERDILTAEIKSGSVGEIISLGMDELGFEQFSSKGGAGTGGNISLESRSGAVDTRPGNLSSYSLESQGGSVTLSAFGEMKTGNITSSSGYFSLERWVRAGTGTGSGGNIALTSRAGAIDTSMGHLSSYSWQGNGGSVTLSAFGDIKTGHIDSSSSGYYDSNTGTLIGTGSGGNINISSSAGAIDTAGGRLDSYSNQGNGGSVTLTASGDITAGDIWSDSGTGTGGNIEFNSSAGGIDTASGELVSYSDEGDGGSVTLTAAGGITTGNITSSSGFYDRNTYTALGTGSGGKISLNSSAGAIDTTFGWLDSSSVQGNGGSVTLRASGDIKTGDIKSSSSGTGSGGNIEINSSAGGINTASGRLNSYSIQGNGGSANLTAFGDIKTGDIDLSASDTGSGGNITLNSSAGGIDTALGHLSTSSILGNGGSLTLTASGDIKTWFISSYSYGTGSGGDIELNSSAGAIDTALGELSSSSERGNGGSVSLTASGDIKTSDIRSSSYTGTGGDIALNSSAGEIDSTLGALNSSSTQGNAGSLTLNASGTIFTGELNSSGFLQGGDITLTSNLSDIVNQGFLESSSEKGAPGNIALNAYAGSISTGNLSGARNVTIAGGGKDEPAGASAESSVTSDADKINSRSGNVTLAAHNDITINEPIKTSSIASLELIAGRSININADIDTSGGSGDIALRANSNSANLNYRDKGPGSVTMAPGTALNAGSGNIVIELGRLAEVGDITLGNINTAGSLTVNAATGNILRSSADSLITAGSAFFQTSILDSGGIGLPSGPLRISTSNLEAKTGSGGAFFESPERGVTVGGATDLSTGIVTSGGGDVAVTAAGDITVTEPVKTASLLSGHSGNITLKSSGGAIDSSASPLNSSSSQGNGGSVTLTASGDIKTAEISSSSNGTGSGGDIALTSSAGGINTASGRLSSSSNQGRGGSVILTASGDIQTADISSFSNGSNGTDSGGDIALSSSAGAIDAASGGLTSFATQGNGGSVTLTAAGDIKTGYIRSSSLGAGSGGNIAINSRAGAIDSAGGRLSSGSNKGNGGSVTLTASGDIKTAIIESDSETGSGGNIEIKSSAGGIDTAGGELNSFSNQGNGGSVTLTASGDIQTGVISSSSNGTGSGGDIALNSSAGGINSAGGALSSHSLQGNGGSVTLTASGEIKTGQIASMAGYELVFSWETDVPVKFTAVSGFSGTGGNITIESSKGAVNTSTGSLNTMSSGGVAGNVTINAAGHVETAGIRSEGFLQGGNISIRSDSPNSISVGGDLDTYSDRGTAGDITLTSPGSITLTGDITSYGQTESGDITVTSESNNVTTNAITTQAGNGPSGNISVNGNNIAAGNLDSIGSTGAGNIEVSAGGSVTTLNIQSRTDEGNSGNIEVSAGGDLSTGDQTTSTGEGDAGNINNTAGSDVTVGNQTASSTNGNSGNIDNSAGRDVTAGNQTSSATNGNSGNLNNSAGGDVTAGNQTSSATNGNAGNITNTAGNNITTGSQTSSAQGGVAGSLTNTAGGNINTGNLTSAGTSGSGDINLTSASGQINTGEIRTDTGEVNINAGVTSVPVPVSAPANPVPVPSSTQTQQPVLSNLTHSVSSDSSINPNVSSRVNSAPDNNDTHSSSSAQQRLASVSVLNSSPLAVNSAEAIAQLEQSRGREFASYFGEDISTQLTATESIRDALATLASQTGNRSAIIYVTALPDQLEIIVLTPEGKSVRQTVPPAKKEELLKAVQEFREEITNVRKRRTASYLKPAQQLYQWLIAPIEPELQAAKIDTLLFSMDAGLRGLPVAALHDGKQFLVEKYSLALIPSVSLIDTRYQPVRGKQVLAMGASEFTDKQPLLAVPVELSEITQKLWQGKAFLNQDFTRANLMGQRTSYPYPIVHLATHGEFQAGKISNSYIQLWQDKLRLDELRNLRLNSPPVELLVLSACRTAVGDEKAELGFAGFAVAAGVKTAVASLWYVSDAGTLGLMTEFYQHLTEAKIKAEALRQAQLAMIRGEVRIEKGVLQGSKSRAGVSLPAELANEGYHNLSHPYYWSGFTMIGSPW